MNIYYKIQHNNLTRKFKYSPEGIYNDDVYLVSLVNEFMIISRRDSERRFYRGEGLTDHLSISEISRLRNYLSDYDSTPIILESDLGQLLVFSDTFSSSMIFPVVFLNGSKSEKAYGIAKSYIDFLHKGEKKNYRKTTLSNDVESVINITENTLKNTVIPQDLTTDEYVEIFNKIFESICEFSGCRASVKYEGEIETDERFDLNLFKSFVICMLMLCRNAGKTREANIRLYCIKDGVKIDVSFESEAELTVMNTPEIFVFRDIAERNNMIFESYCNSGTLTVSLCPSRKDWSYLGLKSEAKFDWNR